MKSFEKMYGSFLNISFYILNPFKKLIIRTECKVHKYINKHALEILKNDNYRESYDFYQSYIHNIDRGVHWADQDFKSSTHLYNPHTNKGLFGRKNALDVAIIYYNKATNLWRKNKKNKSMFFLGAALHIVQDMTIPQHANVRLLDDHRQFEQFIKRTYLHIEEFTVKKGTHKLNSINEYIIFNSKQALKIYEEAKDIEEREARYYKVAKYSLSLAQRTTAGCLLMFYEDVVN